MTFVLLFVILNVACFLIWFGYKKSNLYNGWNDCCVISGTVAFVVTLALFVLSLTLINRQAKFNYIIEQHDNLELMVKSYNVQSDAIKIESLEYDIREKVLEMNNTISKHKVMSQSIWVNPWYSETVGNLKKLEVKPVK